MKIVSESKKKHKDVKLDISIKIPTDYPWKVLNQVTDDLREYLTDSEYELVKLITRLRDIDAYHILSEDWGLQSMNLSGDVPCKCIARYLLASLLKKFRFPTDKALREQTALNKFKAAEVQCKSFNEIGYLNLIAPKDDVTPILFSYMRDFLQKLLGTDLPAHHKLTEWCRHGPGATLDTRDGRISKYHKYDERPYSCTVDAYRYARFVIQSDQRWYDALLDDVRTQIPLSQEITDEVFWPAVLKIVDGDKIAFVPKNAQTERTIAIQPTMNLYLQLGVDGYIRRRLKRYQIDLDDQTKNQKLAYQGSIKTGEKSFVTLDLSAASDTVSLKICQLLLPDAWYRYLVDLRSPQGVLPNKDLVVYDKISSMGNGYTFALESAIFAAVVFAVQKYVDGKIDPSSCAIYGDDLVCHHYIADKVVDLLNLCGFTINTEKSFFSGPVRESCGADWFKGTLVRPVFLEDQPETVLDLLCDINRIDRLLALKVGIEGSNSAKFMEKWIPDQFSDLKGPFSDEEFDSYRHCSTPGRAKGYVYRFRRLVVRPREFGGNKLYFRKLMTDLRPSRRIMVWNTPFEVEAKRPKYEKLTKAGSNFTVTKRNSLTVSKTYSVVSYWRTEYEEMKP